MHFTYSDYIAFLDFQHIKFDYLHALHSLESKPDQSIASLKSKYEQSLFSTPVQKVISQF